MIYSIALDGPAGAGKSSVADDVAKRLGILHLDTGAMYRAFAWRALRDGIDPNDEAALSQLARTAVPEVRFEGGIQHTYMDGLDVTGLIRTPEVSMAASTVSKAGDVRKAMVAAQQALSKRESMILDGRDIGTVVLKDATLKIFLTASPEERAKRRMLEMQAKGEEAVFEDVLADVLRRDAQDTGREVDPLRQAEDAQLLDTTNLTQEQAVNEILRRLDMAVGKKPKCEDKQTPIYAFLRRLMWFATRTILPVTYHHLERAQGDAPYILISNHNTMLDPVIVAPVVYRYQIRFLGKKELAGNPVTKWFFNSLLMIPVDRHNMDMAAMRACLKVLREGHVLGVFPEGTRHKETVMQEMESGIALLALRGKVRMLPVLIDGKARFFHRLHVYIGDPISVGDLAAQGINKETCDKVMTRVADAYKVLAEEGR